MDQTWIIWFTCLCLFFGIGYSVEDDDSTISIATLVPSDPRRLFSKERVAPAMSIAVEKVKDMQLLPNRNLSIKFADSNCNVADGINEAINYYVRKEVDVFFGPCCDYAAAPVARQIRYWNIAMVTPGAMARDFTVAKKIMFNLMTRVGPNFSSLVNFLVEILLVFEWKKVLLLYDPEGQKNIFDRYCHIAADGMHYGFKVQQEIPNLEQNYFKFDDIDDILSGFQAHVGTENAVFSDSSEMP
ncbi:atrial natriuretic peptide receptor 3-like [Ylistrum balloti]|uniref:atrial natriuretic peptide receptor 3-like n=1 Tax=Ylistrum balloti TaxID=509963 RepID=UPI002905932B|nr:atrial natriuretic peptide receptor 3-like [Ylistrum balloti]